MLLKEQLLQEAKNIEASVELDSVFESVELSDEVKANLSTVFEASVKSYALKLAEKHVEKIADKADEEVEKKSDEKSEKVKKELTESASKYFDHIAKEWLVENQLAVDRGIKADLFTSMFEGMKELFVEHNVSLPAESVDVVAELEEALAEEQSQTAKLFESNTVLEATVSSMKRENLIKESVRELTESQKEKVSELVEGIDFSDTFGSKLTAIVGMVKSSVKDSGAGSITESVINKTEDDAEKLNFQTTVVESTEDKSSDAMSAYLNAAVRLA